MGAGAGASELSKLSIATAKPDPNPITQYKDRAIHGEDEDERGAICVVGLRSDFIARCHAHELNFRSFQHSYKVRSLASAKCGGDLGRS
jgi:hypothetical protein